MTRKYKGEAPALGVLIGNPVKSSLSHITHNEVLSQSGINGRYEKRLLEERELQRFMEIEIYSYRWVAVTMPFKEKVIPFLDQIDPAAKIIGAVNTIIVEKGALIGYNTDWSGLLKAIQNSFDASNARVLILGAGGAARAAIYAMQQIFTKITLCNRSTDRGEALAKEFGVTFAKEPPKEYDLLINATSVGMEPKIDEMPIAFKDLIVGGAVFDTVYRPVKTKLLKEAEKKGCTIISGLEMFIELSLEQFHLALSEKINLLEARQSIEKCIPQSLFE